MDVSAEFPGPTPQLVVDDAERAIRFYRTAFGADELVRNLGPDGRVMTGATPSSQGGRHWSCSCSAGGCS